MTPNTVLWLVRVSARRQTGAQRVTAASTVSAAGSACQPVARRVFGEGAVSGFDAVWRCNGERSGKK